MKMNTKNGFTLAELLISLGIVGVLAAVLIPSLFSAMPNKEKLMFKKAYYLVERIVSELVNDDELYPEASGDTAPYLGNTEEVVYNGVTVSGSDKFCKLFALKINRATDYNCVAGLNQAEGPITNYTFKTPDGIVWVLPITTFANNSTAETILVDVNGDNGPNCHYGTNCEKPDKFLIAVYQDGRVSVEDGSIESKYLYSSSIRDDEDEDEE